jgi:hypothetical protein
MDFTGKCLSQIFPSAEYSKIVGAEKLFEKTVFIRYTPMEM